jgi:hypothetical protein
VLVGGVALTGGFLEPGAKEDRDNVLDIAEGLAVVLDDRDADLVVLRPGVPRFGAPVTPVMLRLAAAPVVVEILVEVGDCVGAEDSGAGVSAGACVAGVSGIAVSAIST